jgi:hypothetical protein
MSLLLARPHAGTAVHIPEQTLGIPVPHIRIAWRPEQFDRVTNPGFETNTTGWSVSAGLNAAGTTITRLTTDAYAGSACGALNTGATLNGGVNFDFGSMPFYSMVAYTLRVALKGASGGRRAKVLFGSEGGDYATLHIQDLRDVWTEYEVRWRPAATRTDVQLAVVTADDRQMTIRIDAAHVFLDSFSQVENGDFEESTTGWTAASGGSVALSSPGVGGSRAGRVTTTTTIFSGVDYTLSGTYVSGRTYRLRYAARPLSGSETITVGLGDIGASDRTSASQVLLSRWAIYTLDWTPSDRTAVSVNFRNAAAAANLFDIDEVEVYEALDEVGADVLTWSRGASFDGSGDPSGTLNLSILDPDSVYTPRNAASTLYGATQPGKRVLARADYEDRLYPLAYGIIRTLTPDPFELKVHVQAEDGLFELSRRSTARAFSDDLSYVQARGEALSDPGRPIDTTGTYVTGGAPILLSRQTAMATDSVEASTFFDGTDDTTNLLGYLEALNQATRSIHWCEPSPHAQVGWIYRTRTRASITGAPTYSFTYDEDFQDLSDVSVRDESLITRQRVSYQGYDLLLPPDHGSYTSPLDGSTVSGSLGAGVVLYAVDPSSHTSDFEIPYLTYTREQYGDTDEPKPETVYRIRKRWVREEGWKKGDRGPKRRKRWVRRAVGQHLTGTFVPVDVDAGTHQVLTFDFNLPIADMSLSTQSTFGSVTVIEPARAVLGLYGDGANTQMTGVYISGRPFIPRDEGDVERTSGFPVFEAGPIDSPYIPGPAAAEGLADYVTWRYGAGRLRPQVIDQFFPNRMLGLDDPGDRVYLSADRWYLDALPCVLTSLSGEISRGATVFRMTYSLEELPEESTWVSLGGSSAEGIGGSAVLAH